jgi:hypothetical protein
MFNKNKKNLKKLLAHIENVAGKRIRKFPKHVQEDALHEAIIAYLEKKDIVEHLNKWYREERAYEKKILAFTRARPLARDRAEFLKVFKEYR